ncbi:hypothetical protein V8F20_000058 [Naviculisporaceae sp. PSN 640]
MDGHWDQTIEMGAALNDPGDAHYPSMTDAVTDGADLNDLPRGPPLPDEDIRMTAYGWMRVDKTLWRMTHAQARKLEPAFIALIIQLGMLLIPRDWPAGVQSMIRRIIGTIDPRKGASHAKLYRDNVYDPMRRRRDPALVAIWAAICTQRAMTRLKTQLAEKLRARGMEFVINFNRLLFSDDGLRVADRTQPEGARQWIAVGTVDAGGATKPNLAIRMDRDRALPIYILHQDERLTVTQPDIIPLQIPATYQDFGVAETTGGGAILVTDTHAVIRPPIITDDRMGNIIGPPAIIGHPFFAGRYITAAPLDHPLSTGRAQGRDEGLNYQGPLLLRTEDDYATVSRNPADPIVPGPNLEAQQVAPQHQADTIDPGPDLGDQQAALQDRVDPINPSPSLEDQLRAAEDDLRRAQNRIREITAQMAARQDQTTQREPTSTHASHASNQNQPHTGARRQQFILAGRGGSRKRRMRLVGGRFVAI